MTIPASAPTGYQYIGWIIDPFNSIMETDEQNNGVTLAWPTLIGSNRAPSACLSAWPTSGTAPLNVDFDASCSSDPDGDSLSYTWDFGDGNIGYGAQASNWYYTSGSYWVTLTVTDPSGATSYAYQNIYVSSSCDGSPHCLEEPA